MLVSGCDWNQNSVFRQKEPMRFLPFLATAAPALMVAPDSAQPAQTAVVPRQILVERPTLPSLRSATGQDHHSILVGLDAFVNAQPTDQADPPR